MRAPADLLELAGERIAEIEAAARQADQELAQAAAQVRVDELLERPDGSRERLFGEIANSVTMRSAALREEAEALVALLARCAALLDPMHSSEPIASERVQGSEYEQGHRTADPYAAELEEERAVFEPQGPGTPVSEGVRLLATQMAVAGSSRREIEDRLRRELNVRDPETLVDEVLGSARVH